MLRYSVVLFDLDGTLLDTNELIFASFQYTLDRYSPGTYSREAIIPLLGEPLDDTLKRFDPEQAEAMADTYREHNIAHHDQLIKLFPYVHEVVAKLYEAGIELGIVTNKQRITAEMGLDRYDLRRFMKTVICYGDAERPKPDAAPIQLALKQMGATAEQALMVGDSRLDLIAAQRAGVDSAVVAWSLHDPALLQQYSPTHTIIDMRELLSLVGIKGRE